MSKIVLEDFNEGNGYYKVNLAYLNKEQVEEIEALVSKWNPTDEDIKSCIGMCLTDVNEQRFKDYGTNLKDCLAWLEKQGKQDMIPLDKVIKFLDEQLVNDKDEVTGEPFINFQNYGAFKETFISYFKRKMLEKQGEKFIPEDINEAALQYVDTCAVDGEITHDNVTEPYWNNHSMMSAYKAGWLEKQGEQKPVDKVEPKFKVGDKLVSTKNPRLTYEVLKVGNVNELGNFEYEIEIFTDEKPGIQVGDTFKEHNIHLMECVKVDEWAKLIDEAKPKWSEEDEIGSDATIELLEYFINYAPEFRKPTIRRSIDWLKSIKKRMEE